MTSVRLRGDAFSWQPFTENLVYARHGRDFYNYSEVLQPVPEVMTGLHVDEQPTGTVYTQRVGPFTSTGGYDKWDVYWHDVASLSSFFGDAEIDITAHGAGPVDEFGASIAYPPLHVHHLWVYPSRWRKCSSDACIPVLGHAFSIVLGQPGDSQCAASEAGVDGANSVACLSQEYGGYAKRVRAPLRTWQEINDVRRRGSPPLVWWLQLSFVAIEARRERAALSFAVLHNPSCGGPVEGASPSAITPYGCAYTKYGSELLPSSAEDSFFVYTSAMPVAGRLVGSMVRVHAHKSAFQQAFLFGSAPEPLGLEQTLATRTSQMPHATNRGFAAHLLQQRGLVCHGVGSVALIEGSMYDRSARVDCQPWTFELGTPYTIVSLNGLPLPGVRPASNAFLAAFPQHTHFMIHYEASDGRSHFSWWDGNIDEFPDLCGFECPEASSLGETASINAAHSSRWWTVGIASTVVAAFVATARWRGLLGAVKTLL